MYTDHQLKRAGSIQQAKCNKQNVKKELLIESCQRNGLHIDSFPARTRSQIISKGSDSNVLQLVYVNKQQELPSTHTNQLSQGSPYQRDSLEKLCLDFKSVGFSKEDEDSASDISDSERTLSNPLLPFTPPKLNLRAEDIKPGYFSHHVEYNRKHYSYPDFLPPPYSSWNLSQVSVFVNKEKHHMLQSTPSCILEKYVERLLQLEWLQMQTVQSEKAKTAKLRPQTASSMSRTGKTLGKSIYSPVHTKQITHPCNTSENISGQDIYDDRKYLHPESSCLTYACKSWPNVPGTRKIPVSVLTLPQDKKILIPNPQQVKNTSIDVYNSKIQSAGKIRHQTQSSVFSYSRAVKEPKQARSYVFKKVEGDQQPYCLQKCSSKVKCSSKHSELPKQEIIQSKKKPK